MGAAWVAAVLSLAPAQTPELRVTVVGNAGVLLSDGTASLLVDLPYRPGAFGYMEYRPEALDPPGSVVSVITHHHADHFDADLFRARREWRVAGPPSVTEGLPPERVLSADSVEVGAFAVVALPTPHTPDHRSYRIRWRGRVLHFTGDTEDPTSLADGPAVDILFITPWLSCAVHGSGTGRFGRRSIVYHLRPDGGDRRCGPVEALEKGAGFTVRPGGPGGGEELG